MNIAIYDLDKTITRRPTFTRFLLFHAQRRSPLRLLALPIWIAALLGYRLGLYGRKPLKQFGIAMFMGRRLPTDALKKIVLEFIDVVVIHDLQPGAVQSITNDRAQGSHLVIATAAPAFYAEEIGTRLGFDHVVATRHIANRDGTISNHIDGENCYGEEKLKMVSGWVSDRNLTRADCTISVYSDHHSDAPLLDWADKPFLVNASNKMQELARQKKWQVLAFSATIDAGR